MSCGPRDWVEPGKNACDLVRILGVELAAIIFQKQPLQPFVPEFRITTRLYIAYMQ